MYPLLYFLSWLIQSAHARTLEQVGSDDQSVREMWRLILNVFPHTFVPCVPDPPIFTCPNYAVQVVSYFGVGVAQFILGTIAAAGVALIIYAGIVLTTSQGEKLEESKKIIRNVAIGLIAAMLADAIVLFVLRFITVATQIG